MTDPMLVDLPVPIHTPRLLMRPARPDDGAALFEAKEESWPELARWNIWTWGRREDHTAEQDELMCRRKQVKFLLREDLTFLSFDRASGKFIGVAGLPRCNWQGRSFMLGFWVRSGEARRGYASEAANAMTRYAFDVLGANKVFTFHAGGNIGSQGVIEKIGFQLEGILRRQHLLANGSLADEHHYGLLDAAPLPPLDVSWG